MKLIAIMPVRNEEWILGLSLRAALTWCNAVVVGLHACTDRSTSIVGQIKHEHPGRIIPAAFDGETWTEMEHRHALLNLARQHGATHIAIVDADEILTGNLLGRIRSVIAHRRPDELLELPGYNLRVGIDRYHDNGVWGNRWFSVAFADRPELHWTGDRFHHREPMGASFQRVPGVRHCDGGIMHLWGASQRRLKAKHALYKLTERLRWPNKPIAEIDRLYSLAVRDQGWTYTAVPEAWWQPYAKWMRHLDLDAEPWQIEECYRLVRENPGLDAGFDLFGIIGP